MRFTTANNKSQALEPNLTSLDEEYPYNNLTPKDKKNSATRLQESRMDSMNDLLTKKNAALANNANTKSES